MDFTEYVEPTPAIDPIRGDIVEILWLDAWSAPGSFDPETHESKYPRFNVGIVIHLDEWSVTVCAGWIPRQEELETTLTVPKPLIQGVNVLGHLELPE